jgi:hypothetical protein
VDHSLRPIALTAPVADEDSNDNEDGREELRFRQRQTGLRFRHSQAETWTDRQTGTGRHRQARTGTDKTREDKTRRVQPDRRSHRLIVSSSHHLIISSSPYQTHWESR